MRGTPHPDPPPQGGREWPDAPARRRLVHELFLALRRGFVLGECRTCETFCLMAKLCLDESGAGLAPDERGDLESWVAAGSILDLDFGCEDACAIVPLYGRLAP